VSEYKETDIDYLFLKQKDSTNDKVTVWKEHVMIGAGEMRLQDSTHENI